MRIVLRNSTNFRDDDLRKLISRTLTHVGYNRKMGVDLRVQVSSSRGRALASGRASLGDRKFRQHGTWMKLVLPPRGLWDDDSWRRIVAVTVHECMHLVGSDHKDMTEGQYYCTLPLPAWAEGLQLREVEVAPKPSRAERTAAARADSLKIAEARLADAERRAKQYATQLKRSKTLATKWRRRVAVLKSRVR